MKCPYCDTEAECDEVDIGVGIQQAGPYYCPECRAVQFDWRDAPNATDEEKAKGWWAPGGAEVRR
jgi:hypothetical protein